MHIKRLPPDALQHHGIKGQKWGVRRFQNSDGTLTSAGKERYSKSGSEHLSNELYSKAQKIEPKLTKDVSGAVSKTNAIMYGLEHRLKTKESIKRKIETDAFNDNVDFEKAASNIKDTVRYTAVSSDRDFTKNYYKIKNELLDKGYVEVRCKNYFDLYNQGKVKHKSVQSVFQNSNGNRFEMQFQTHASQNVKDRKVPLYEEARQKDISKKRLHELERQMESMAEEIPTPKDIYKIKTHN